MGNMLDKTDRSSYKSFAGYKVEKKERYGWAGPSDPGVFMLINKNDLNIDDTYQRSVSSDVRIRAIAREWDWRLFCTILVSMRPAGSFWVVDGGHRVRASFYRGDIVDLPCMVFENSEEGEAALRVEARAFIGKGTMRSAISSCSKFKAGVVAKNDVDLKANEIVAKNGYRVSSGGGGNRRFSAIGIMKRLIPIDEQLAARVFDACADIAEGDRIPGGAIAGIFRCAERTRGTGVDILAGPYLETLKRAGIKGIERYIRDAKYESGKGGEVVEAKAILNLLNYKRRNRISWG